MTGDLNYQLVRCDVTITKNYWTIRFPLESHQLRIYIESDYMINDVVFVPDIKDSGLNQNLGISGFDVIRTATGSYTRYVMKMPTAIPEVPKDGVLITSEHVTAIEINRTDTGLYVKMLHRPCRHAYLGIDYTVYLHLPPCPIRWP